MQRVLSFPPQSNRRFGDPGEFVSKRMCFSFMFSIAFLAILAGFLLGRFVFDQELELSKAKLRKVNQEISVNPKNFSHIDANTFISQVSVSSLGEHLRSLQNRSGESKSLHEARLISRILKEADFDLISPLVDSQINLSFPSINGPNQVRLMVGNEARLTLNDSRAGILGGYLDSASAGGNIYYVNFGRDEDYHLLDSLGLSVKDSIVLVRVGRASVLDLVTNAFEHEAEGVVLYRDPQQRDVGEDFFPPSDLAKLNSLHKALNGGGAVPVVCIASEDALKLFREMSTSESSPESWRGDLNCSYPIGPGLVAPDRKLVMHVNTETVVKKFYDVLGAMRGSQEPDRFVMIVHERVSDEGGDESAAIIMEIIRILGIMRKSKDWRPHRSVVVASWGTNGRYHSRTRDWWSQVNMKAVAYLKIDSSFLGNGSVSSRGSPILENVFTEATSVASLTQPKLDVMMQTSTEAGVIDDGVPFLELVPGEKRSGRSHIKQVTDFWSVLTLKLSQNSGLPFSLGTYVKFFNHSLNVIEQKFTAISQKHGLFLRLSGGCEGRNSEGRGLTMKDWWKKVDHESFFEATQGLIAQISSFQSKWSLADSSKFIDMRIMNDQFLTFSHALACQKERSSFKNSFRHKIFSPSTKERDETAGFGLLQDLLRETFSTEAPGDLQQQIINHLADLVECINEARYALTDGLESFVRPA